MKTKVVFRYWEKSVIALFPEIPNDAWGTYCESYQHIGQHGGADYYGIIERSRPATPEEYACLKDELESIGYDLQVIRRTMPVIHETRRDEARKQWRTTTKVFM